MRLRLRMCDEDQKLYGGPEWVVYDAEAMLDLRASEAERLEMEMDSTIFMVNGNLARRFARAVRAALWLARRQAGLKDAFAEFNPKVGRVDLDVEIDGADDADEKSLSTEAPGGDADDPPADGPAKEVSAST